MAMRPAGTSTDAWSSRRSRAGLRKAGRKISSVRRAERRPPEPWPRTMSWSAGMGRGQARAVIENRL